MEATASSTCFFQTSLGVSKSLKSGSLNHRVSQLVSFGKCQSLLRHCASVSLSSGCTRMVKESRRSLAVRAGSPSMDSAGSAPIGPVRLESPVGQFLSEILLSHPHLVSAAAEQQLEQLQTEHNSMKHKEELSASASGTDLVLYRRIAEVKANERRKALEDILYALIVQKFMDANVSLVPAIGPALLDSPSHVDLWPVETLEQLHSPEVYEMIQNHLSLVMGSRSGDSTSVAQISKFRIGQIYAASIIYGYFLKRVDQRFQLEKSIKVLPGASNNDGADTSQPGGADRRLSFGGDLSVRARLHPEVMPWNGGTGSGSFNQEMKTFQLRNYVMSFEGETVQRYATVRSKEAVNIIEKHTEALFGRPEIVITPLAVRDSSEDEMMQISFGGLRRLVLEAVTFGSFLWDVESYVDSRCHIVIS